MSETVFKKGWQLMLVDCSDFRDKCLLIASVLKIA
jgi:hypothetical protein